MWCDGSKANRLILTSPQYCSCGLRRHIPEAAAAELHHVIPQAWQHFKLGNDKLFDPRTVPLAPTCHRLVHHWLVLLMKDRMPPKYTKADERYITIADLGCRRFVEAGGLLDDLRMAHLWGEA